MPAALQDTEKFLPEDREPLRAALLSEIQRLYAEKGVTEFYTGGARGFDTMAAEAVLKIREALPVRLHLILPCKGQSDRWHFAEKRRYREILKQADTRNSFLNGIRRTVCCGVTTPW